MTGFYSSNVEKKIKGLAFTPNELEYYDNVTYNIRFYMISQEYQQELFKYREIFNDVKIKDENKVIIAETGASSNYSIDDLTLKVVYNQKGSIHNCLTYNIMMEIKEVNDCSLSNKIAVIKALLGYESYVDTPYHIDIWFSGYDHYTKKPIKYINNKVYTYEVLCSEVKSTLDATSGTVWKFDMVPTYSVALKKDTNIIVDNGILSSLTGNFEDMKQKIQNSVNKKFFEQNPNLTNVYNNDYLTINLKDFSNISLNDISYNNGDLKAVFSDSGSTSTTMNKNISPKSTDSSTSVIVKPDVSIALDNIFQELCFMTPNYKNCVAIPTYKSEPFLNYNNQELYKIYMTVVILPEPYLMWFDKHIGELKNNEIEQMQLEALNLMRLENTLVKKYQFAFNGEDTNVLEVRNNVDNLWFLNIGVKNISDAITSSKEVLTKKIAQNPENLITYLNNKINNAISNSYKDLNKVRKLARDNRLYIDDIYNCLNTKQREDILNNRPILQKQGLYNGNDTVSSNNTDEIVSYEKAKIGFNNLYTTDNMIENRITILGDPYWIQIPSDEYIYSSNILPPHSLSYHFYFRLRTNVYADGMKRTGGYNADDAIDLAGIYMIIESTSNFKDGKFTQELYGCIDPRFMFSSK